MSPNPRTPTSFFHLHLVSDATGETLATVARAVVSQYPQARAIEHVYPLIRSVKQIDRVIAEIEKAPGIVLFTIVDAEITARLSAGCREAGIPAVSVLDPVTTAFQSYLGAPTQKKVGAQHVLDQDYFQRIDALNFTLMHDDGQLPDAIYDADVVIVGISRTSKTPTSIYLANRGLKTTNVPIVPGVPVPDPLFEARRPLIVGLVASADRIIQIRQNRLLSLNAPSRDSAYVDRAAVAEEIAYMRRLCTDHDWPVIDVTRRSIEETAAAILALYQERRQERGRIG